MSEDNDHPRPAGSAAIRVRGDKPAASDPEKLPTTGKVTLPNGPPPQPKIDMSTEFEGIGPCKKNISIEITGSEVNSRLRKHITDLHKQVTLPGFRRGHVPIALIEKRFGQDVRKDVKLNLLIEGYQQAYHEGDLQPIAGPEVQLDSIEMEEGEPLKYDLTVEVWPEFEPEGYEGLKLEKPSSVPTEEEIEAEIGSLKMRTTKFEEVEDEPALEDDFLLCDYKIVIEDEEVASAEDVGAKPSEETVGRFRVPGLKDALTGKNTGETVNLDFTVGDEHMDENLRGKPAALRLSVKGIRRAIVPEATDEWAKELGFDSLEELKSVVARNAEAAKEREAEAALRRQVYDRLLEMMKFDLPEDAVRRQQKDIFARERMGMRYRGATEQDMAKINDEIEEASLERAERDLKVFFILSKIADKEGIQATAEDVEMRVAELAARYRTTSAKMRQQLEREGMLSEIFLQIQEEKTVSHILSKAEVSQVEAEKKAEAQKPAKPKVKKKAAAKGKKKAEGPSDQQADEGDSDREES